MADYTDYRLTDWLPTNRKEAELRGWDELDVVLFSADFVQAYRIFSSLPSCTASIPQILESG